MVGWWGGWGLGGGWGGGGGRGVAGKSLLNIHCATWRDSRASKSATEQMRFLAKCAHPPSPPQHTNTLPLLGPSAGPGCRARDSLISATAPDPAEGSAAARSGFKFNVRVARPSGAGACI